MSGRETETRESAADPARERRIAEVVGAVARAAMRERGATRIALLDDGGPEAALAARLLARTLGEDAVARVTATAGEVEPLLHGGAPGIAPERAADELRRMRARLVDGALAADPANKTALLLGGDLPPEPLLPLADLYAGQVAALAGGWSGPHEVRRIAGAAGGIEALDAALARYFEGRDPSALDALPAGARALVREALARGRASRATPRVVPKLGTRTLCVDLFE